MTHIPNTVTGATIERFEQEELLSFVRERNQTAIATKVTDLCAQILERMQNGRFAPYLAESGEIVGHPRQIPEIRVLSHLDFMDLLVLIGDIFKLVDPTDKSYGALYSIIKPHAEEYLDLRRDNSLMQGTLAFHFTHPTTGERILCFDAAYMANPRLASHLVAHELGHYVFDMSELLPMFITEGLTDYVASNVANNMLIETRYERGAHFIELLLQIVKKHEIADSETLLGHMLKETIEGNEHILHVLRTVFGSVYTNLLTQTYQHIPPEEMEGELELCIAYLKAALRQPQT